MAAVDAVTTKARRAYLTEHKVQAALATATATVLMSSPDTDPTKEIGRVLLDPTYCVVAGGAKGGIPEAYVERWAMTAKIAAAVKLVIEQQPMDPVAALAQLLIAGTVETSAPPAAPPTSVNPSATLPTIEKIYAPVAYPM